MHLGLFCGCRLLYAQTLIPRTEVLQTLRGDILGVVLGVLIVAVALAALLLHALRGRAKDPTLLWFGLFAALYGTRVLIEARSVRFALALPDGVWPYALSIITYTILLPTLLFLAEVFPAWRRVLRWIVGLQAIFAVAGAASDLWLRRPLSLGIVNNVLVLAYALTLSVVLLRATANETVRAIRVGLFAFFFTIIITNLADLGVMRFFNLEPIGFAAFLASLGWVMTHRILANEERLISIEKELEIARRIQQSILPREMPASDSLRIAARYLPMTAVAGDLYDFLVIDHRHVGILVADVSGHGVPAALIASMVKVAIASQLPHADDPARVLRGVNQTLCGKLQGQFVTAAYLFLDLETQRLRYAAAGHPPLLWWHAADQRVEDLEQNGMVLGFFAHAPYAAVERDLAPGDRFLLYTDGLLEATNGTEEFYGPERLRASLSAAARTDAGASLAAIIDRLSTWSGRVGALQEDDLTAVFIETR